MCVLVQDGMDGCQWHQKSCTLRLGQVQHGVNRTFLLEPTTEGAKYDFSLLSFILLVWEEAEENTPHLIKLSKMQYFCVFY